MDMNQLAKAIADISTGDKSNSMQIKKESLSKSIPKEKNKTAPIKRDKN